MRAREIVSAYYELDPPAGLQREAEIVFVQGQVEDVLTHEKGGYMWGTFNNAKDNVGFYLSYCISLLHIDYRRSSTTAAILR